MADYRLEVYSLASKVWVKILEGSYEACVTAGNAQLSHQSPENVRIVTVADGNEVIGWKDTTIVPNLGTISTYYAQQITDGSWYDLTAGNADMMTEIGVAKDTYAKDPSKYTRVTAGEGNIVIWTSWQTGPGTDTPSTGDIPPTPEVKESEFKRLWKAYEPLWILMIAGFSSAVLGIILITWYKHGAPLPQGA